MRLYLFLILFTSLLIISCAKEAEIEAMVSDGDISTEPGTYPNADQRLWPYFSSFENEARARGLSFDLNKLNVLGLIEAIDEPGVAGHCTYGAHIDNEVTISSTFWNRANTTAREFVVFHELGHCVLLRGHEESSFSNGTCRSMMRSGLEDCRDNYRESTRSAYLDELFSEDNS